MRKIFNLVCWIIFFLTLIAAAFSLVPGSRYLNLTIVASIFLALASTNTRKPVKTVYMVNTDDRVVILSNHDVAVEWAKNTNTKVIAVPLDTVFGQPEKKTRSTPPV